MSLESQSKPSWAALRAVPALVALAAVNLTAARAWAAEREDAERLREDKAEARRTREEHPRAIKPLWLDAGFGWQRLDLTTFYVQRAEGSTALTADLAPQVVSGPGASVGIGGRLYLLTLGVRFGTTFFDVAPTQGTDGSMRLYSVDLELGSRIPIGRLEPYIVFGAGYSVLGGIGDAFYGLGKGLDIDGANGRLGLGVDYFMSPNVSLGVRGTGEVLFLARRGVPLRDLATAQSVNTIGEAKARALEGGGSSVGTAFAVMVGPSLHF